MHNEFDLGKSDKEDKVVIGFRLSSYAAGSTAVGPIDNLCHIPDKMKVVVKVSSLKKVPFRLLSQICFCINSILGTRRVHKKY